MNAYCYVYVLQSLQDRMFYVGFTKNLRRRLQEHNNGLVSSTKRRRPFELVYWEGCINPTDATRREQYLKSSWGQTIHKEPSEELSHGVNRFILFHQKRHPREMGETEIRQFISHLAVNENISASTQTVALSALLFLYRDVLKKDLPYVSNIERARKLKRLPTVFTREETKRILANLEGTHWLIGGLLYGSGLRLMECLRLRVKDIDFTYGQITVRESKGEKDRVTMLAARLKQPLMRHLQKVKLLHDEDLDAGYGEVFLPYALARKYPNAPKHWGWQYVFSVSNAIN